MTCLPTWKYREMPETSWGRRTMRIGETFGKASRRSVCHAWRGQGTVRRHPCRYGDDLGQSVEKVVEISERSFLP